MLSARATRTASSATVASATSPCSASIRSRSSPRLKAAWRPPVSRSWRARCSCCAATGLRASRAKCTRRDEGAWYYEQQCLGFNYRMTEVQAALGLSQLQRLAEWVARRHELAAAYDTQLRRAAGDPAARVRPDRARPSICTSSRSTRRARARAAESFSSACVRRALGSTCTTFPCIPIRTTRRWAFSVGMFPEAEAYYEHCLSLPMFAALTDADLQRGQQCTCARR